MSRQIKFKGLWEANNSGKREWSFYSIGGAPVLLNAHWVTKDLQYIGKDANGDDIYEDDLVVGEIWNWQKARVFRVKYDETSLAWFPFNESYETAEGDEKLSPSSVEVIGNYEENPKSIKGPENGKWNRQQIKIVTHEVNG